MGFFSAIKKFFGQEGPDSAQPIIPAAAPVETAAEKAVTEKAIADAGVEPVQPEKQGPEGEIGAESLAGAMSDETSATQARDEAAPDAGPEQQNVNVAETAPKQDEADSVPAAASAGPEEHELVLRLRTAEPRLSQWLDIILEGQEQADERFWQRLKFLLRSLEAPEPEIEAFATDFANWLDRMEYHYIDEFRSELQYRLALALDLEDEEDERNRLLVKLGHGLAATRMQLGRRLDSLFARHGALDDAFWEEMEELFIMSDMGYEPALEIVERLKRRAVRQNVTQPEAARQLLLDELEEIFRVQPRIRAANKPEVILMIGVNGAGKTTTIAKLAHRERMAGKKVLVAAADTFRAAAIEQLQVWAERAGADFYAKPAGSDPASVAWEAMDYALKNDIDVVFVDTAGRLQTRVNLMEELGKIRQVLGKKHQGAPHRSMLVLDATTGQNALSQAKLFREAAGADEIVLTKLDGTAKGGVAIAVVMQERLPITFIGLGEKMEDLRPFNGRDFARAILAEPVVA